MTEAKKDYDSICNHPDCQWAFNRKVKKGLPRVCPKCKRYGTVENNSK